MERTDNMKRKQILSSICAAAMAVSCMTVSVDAGYSDIVWEEYGETIRAPYIAYHIHRSGTVWTPPEEDAGDTSWEDGFNHILYKHYEGDCWHDGYDIYRCETTDGAPGSEAGGSMLLLFFFVVFAITACPAPQMSISHPMPASELAPRQ